MFSLVNNTFMKTFVRGDSVFSRQQKAWYSDRATFPATEKPPKERLGNPSQGNWLEKCNKFAQRT